MSEKGKREKKKRGYYAQIGGRKDSFAPLYRQKKKKRKGARVEEGRGFSYLFIRERRKKR